MTSTHEPQGPRPFVEADFSDVLGAGRHHRRYWRDLWAARGLFYYLAWRDLRVKYKQTVIGVAWGLIKPLLSMLVFTFIFGKMAKLPQDSGTSYHTMVFAGLLPWQLFANGILHSTQSLVRNAQLVSKVYFPRMILPTSALVNGLVDFLFALGMLFILMLLDGSALSWRIVFLPLFILLALMPALGLGLWFSALNVRYRDMAYLVPFLLQLGQFVSPVGFNTSNIPDEWRLAYSLNPMVGIIDGMRWCVLDGADVDPRAIAFSVVVCSVALFFGFRYFRQTEATFADQI